MNLMSKVRIPSVSLFFAFLVLVISCEQGISETEYLESETAASSPSEQPQSYSGQQWFKAIFFGQGEIAEKLSHFEEMSRLKSQMTPEEHKAFENFQNELISQIDVEHPQYFENFKKAIHTKNQVVIRNKLSHSKDIITAVVEAITDLDYEEIEKKIIDEKSNYEVDLDRIEALKRSEQFLPAAFQDLSMRSSSPNMGVFTAAVLVVAVVAVQAALATIMVVVDTMVVMTKFSVRGQIAEDEEEEEKTSIRFRQEHFINSILTALD